MPECGSARITQFYHVLRAHGPPSFRLKSQRAPAAAAKLRRRTPAFRLRIMIPTSLGDWTLDAGRSVAASGITENDIFDLKADLQPAEHQRKIVAAFANTRGWYLVFGVDNNRQLVGVQNVELPRDFGSKLRAGIEPAVDFMVGKPMPVAVDRFVVVIEVPRSQRVPHAVLLNNSWSSPNGPRVAAMIQ
jgi:hypothetical protein